MIGQQTASCTEGAKEDSPSDEVRSICEPLTPPAQELTEARSRDVSNCMENTTAQTRRGEQRKQKGKRRVRHTCRQTARRRRRKTEQHCARTKPAQLVNKSWQRAPQAVGPKGAKPCATRRIRRPLAQRLSQQRAYSDKATRVKTLASTHTDTNRQTRAHTHLETPPGQLHRSRDRSLAATARQPRGR